jgi:hypothetical protein
MSFYFKGVTYLVLMLISFWAVEADGLTLTVNSDGASDVNISSSTEHGGNTNYTITVASGSTVTLTAPASVGDRTFLGWTGNFISGVYSSKTLTFVMNNNKTVIANFGYILTVTCHPAIMMSGFVDSQPEGFPLMVIEGVQSMGYISDTSIYLLALQPSNYHFVNWSGTAVDAGKVGDPYSELTTVMMDGDYTMVVNFAEDPVYFADPNLKAAVEATLGITNPTQTDMLGLTSFTATSKDITSLVGLEYGDNLNYLNLNINQIIDISPLAGMTHLSKLVLSNNQISDISCLAGMTSLNWLNLSDNQISDISCLAGMNSLTWLNLGNNLISDISPLVSLTHLTFIYLRGNPLNNEAYCTYLRAIRDNNPGIENPDINFVYGPNLNPPSGVSATKGTYTDKVEITWNPWCGIHGGPSEYRIYRSDSEEGVKTALGDDWQTATTYDDTTATSGTPYYYWVRAKEESVGVTNYSSYDTGWCGTTDNPPTLNLTSPASNITVQAVQGQTVTITWTDSDPDSNAKINLYRDTDTTSDPWSNGINHTSIHGGFDEDPDGSEDQYLWSGIENVPGGTYSIWGYIYDGVNDRVYSRALGLVTIINAGNTLGDAYDIGVLSDGVSQQFTDWVGYNDQTDCYKFILDSNAPKWFFSLLLAEMTKNADVQLLNNNGEVIWQGNGVYESPEPKSTTCILDAGTYYIHVYPHYPVRVNETNYTLTIEANSITPPTVSTLPASDVNQTSVTLWGRVDDDGGEACTCLFHLWSADTQTWPNYELLRRTGEEFSVTVYDLQPNTVYYFEAEGYNSAGGYADWDNMEMFTTLAIQYILTTSSTNGGTISTPGIGEFPYDYHTSAPVTATANANYHFVNWSGTAVDAGKVANPNVANTTVIVDNDYTLIANFEVANPIERPETGNLIGEIDFNNLDDFLPKVQTNNYEDPNNPEYNRSHIEYVKGFDPDPEGMMLMQNLEDIDPGSPSSGKIIFARFKASFGPCSSSRILVRFLYLFERSAPSLEIVVYLSDVPELLNLEDPLFSKHYKEIGRVPEPPEGNSGSVGSDLFGSFEERISSGSLVLKDGMWVELILFEKQVVQENKVFIVNNMLSSSSSTELGAALVDDLAAEGDDCDIICMNLNNDDWIDVLDLLTVIGSYGNNTDLFEGGTGSMRCFDGGFSDDGYIDIDDIRSWDYAFSYLDRSGLNLCTKVPTTTSEFSSLMRLANAWLESDDEHPVPLDLTNWFDNLIISGKRCISYLDPYSFAKDSVFIFKNDGTYKEKREPNSIDCNVRIVRDPNGNLYQINSEIGIIKLDGSGKVIVPPRQIEMMVENKPVTVSIGLQNQDASPYGRPILDAAFDKDYVYVVPVVVNPVGEDSYLTAAKLELLESDNLPYQIVQLYGNSPEQNDNKNICNNLREIEVDNDGNVYMINAYRDENRSDMLWKYDPNDPNGKTLLVPPLEFNGAPKDPISMYVSDKTNSIYLASGQYSEDKNSSTVYRFSKDNFTREGSITIINGINYIQHVTGITEDVDRGILWIVGFNIDYVDFESNIVDYSPKLAYIPLDSFDSNNVKFKDIPNDCDLGLPMSIVWTGDK